jgi:ATP-binding cassette, subfamily B, bacterial
VSETSGKKRAERTDFQTADRLLRRVFRNALPSAGFLALTAVCIAVAETAFPAILGQAVDELVSEGDAGSWLLLAGALVAFLVAVDALDDLAIGATAARSTAWLRHTLLGHVLALGPRTARPRQAGDLATRLVGNTAQAGRLAPNLIRAGANLIPGLGGVVALALIDPWLCLTFLAGMPVLVLIVRSFARDASEVATRYLRVQGTIASRLVDALSGARTIAAAGTMERERERVLEPLPELHRHGLDNWRTQMRLVSRNDVIVPLIVLAVVAVAGAELANGRITAGELLAASQYAVLATMLGNALASLASLAQIRSAAQRVAEVLEEPAPPQGGAPLPQGPGKLDFNRVTVRVGGKPALADVQLTVEAGKLVAIVGRSGSGKSLLAALAGRMIDPDAGEVLLDGVPLSEVDRRVLRREVTYAFERPSLFGETIADAIAFGAYRPAESALVVAAGTARADEFIRHTPGGYGARLTATPFSGGEIQRIGLARAFAHAGRVLVMDDVAASLDTITEHHISRAVTEALGDRTRIVVAYRVSTAARADLVVWVDEGRVRAAAPHAELWRDADYRCLFEPDPEGMDASASANGGGR